jgi:hypothetical protein
MQYKKEPWDYTLGSFLLALILINCMQSGQKSISIPMFTAHMSQI